MIGKSAERDFQFNNGPDWSGRLQQQTFSLKVNNTFNSDDHEVDEDVGDAFRRRLQAPAASTNRLYNSPYVGNAPGGGIPNLRMQDFILDDIAPAYGNWDGETARGNWNGKEALQDKGRKKRSDGPSFHPPGAYGAIEPVRGFGVPFPVPEVDNHAPQLLDNTQVPNLMNYNGNPPPPPAAWADTTTVMMRNLPNKYTQRMLLTEINQTGFLGSFDFLYLPIDPETQANRGYAFLNFVNAAFAWMFKLTYEGQKMNSFNSSKVASVMRATLQGFDANYAHYSSARVSRGDPAARPLFLRESTTAQASWTSKPVAKQRGTRNKGIRTDESEMLPRQQAVSHNGRAASDNFDKQHVSGDIKDSAGKQKLVPKFCPHCGNAIQPRFQFCPHCGQTISVANMQ